MNNKATLSYSGQNFELDVVDGSEGEYGLDISQLRSQSGLVTLDPGYVNTGSCQSAITFIDGEKGILRYRGIPIEQFAKSPNFIEVAWLLIFGSLPTRQEYDEFVVDLRSHANLDESLRHQFEGFPRNAPPMAILSAMINAMSLFLPGTDGHWGPRAFSQCRSPTNQQGTHHCCLCLSSFTGTSIQLS